MVGFKPSMVYVKVHGAVPVKSIAISVVVPEQIVLIPLQIFDVGKVPVTVILALPEKQVPVKLASDSAVTW